MQARRSWDAVFNSAQFGGYFDRARSACFDPTRPSFSLEQAWWLAEISRLAYTVCRTVRHEVTRTDREAILNRVDLRCTAEITSEQAGCMLVEPSGSTGQTCTVVAFRGTSRLSDLQTLLRAGMIESGDIGFVHAGFSEAIDSIWETLSARVASSPPPHIYTGHSMGGALAVLAAARRRPHSVYSFGAPRPGDQKFGSYVNAIPIHRIVNGRDVVPQLPPSGESTPYHQVGRLQHISADSEGPIDLEDPYPSAETDPVWPAIRAFLESDNWTEPPLCIADHAPINYVAALQEAVIERADLSGFQ